MKEITLTQGKIALVDDADFEAVSKFKWCARKNKTGIWYAIRSVRKLNGARTKQYLHKFLMPDVPMVDHRDGDGLNDRRENLRPCTRSQNAANSKPHRDGTSRFLGVSWVENLGKWRARIRHQSKEHPLGCFDFENDAAKAYDTAAKKFRGEFARLNFPRSD